MPTHGTQQEGKVAREFVLRRGEQQAHFLAGQGADLPALADLREKLPWLESGVHGEHFIFHGMAYEAAETADDVLDRLC